MSSESLNILICEDSIEDAEIIEYQLGRSGLSAECRRVETIEALREAVMAESWDVVLSDYRMPRFTAIDALREVRALNDRIPFLVVTGSLDEETAVATLKQGADDYILKENLTRLVPAIQSAVRLYESRRESRELEGQLRQSQKLEAVGRLAAGVAHDFNNLLTVIRGYGDLITADPQAETIELGMEQIMSAADRGSKLTRQLLAFGRQHPSRPRRLDPNEVLEGLCELVGRTISQDTMIAPRFGAKGSVDADPVHLEQAFLNLLFNARDAMPSGGTVTIETRDAKLDDKQAKSVGAEPGRYVCIGVQDEGVGIPAENISRIFEPFFTTKQGSGGSGLGLSTTFGIIKQCSGTIHVESEVGQGTRFDVYLPVSAEVAKPEDVAAEPVAAMTLPGGRLLLVEDESAIRAWIAAGLRSHGYDVHEASNGREALDLFTTSAAEVDLIVCDITMPELSGPDLRGRLLEMGSGVPFLFTSGNTDPGKWLKSARGAAFLPKPFGLAELLSEIDAVLGAHRGR